MSGIKIIQQQKDNVIYLWLATREPFQNIAEDSGLSEKNIEEIVNEYCIEHGYESFERKRDSTVFISKETKQKTIIKRDLYTAREIEEWCKKNKKRPRFIIDKVKVAKRRKEETEEQKELRLGRALRRLEDKFRETKLIAIENEQDRETARVIKRICVKYKKRSVELNNKKINNFLLDLEELKEWCQKNSRKPRASIEGVELTKDRIQENQEQRELRLALVYKRIKKEVADKYIYKQLDDIKDKNERKLIEGIREIDNNYAREINIHISSHIKIKTLRAAQEMEVWVDTYKRCPRVYIKGVIRSKDKEETGEQKELRLGDSLEEILNIAKQYNGEELESIKDKKDQEIVRIARKLDKYYRRDLAKEILKLIGTRKATVEQIQIMAKHYGVNLEEIMNSLEER